MDASIMGTLDYVSLACGIATLLGIGYQFAYKNGKTDTILKDMQRDIKNIQDENITYPKSEMSNQLKVLWQVYVMDALQRRPDLVAHQSPLEITDKGESIIPDAIKVQLKAYRLSNGPTHSAAWSVVSCLSLPTIQNISKTLDLTPAITLALLSVFYKKYHPESTFFEPLDTCEPKVDIEIADK